MTEGRYTPSGRVRYDRFQSFGTGPLVPVESAEYQQAVELYHVLKDALGGENMIGRWMMKANARTSVPADFIEKANAKLAELYQEECRCRPDNDLPCLACQAYINHKCGTELPY